MLIVLLYIMTLGYLHIIPNKFKNNVINLKCPVYCLGKYLFSLDFRVIGFMGLNTFDYKFL